MLLTGWSAWDLGPLWLHPDSEFLLRIPRLLPEPFGILTFDAICSHMTKAPWCLGHMGKRQLEGMGGRKEHGRVP